MTEKEKQEIINIVHRTVLGFFDPALDEERYFSQTEKVLLKVNKAICEKIKEMPTADNDRPHGEWIERMTQDTFGYFHSEYECSNCHDDVFQKTEWKFCPNCGADMREGDEK